MRAGAFQTGNRRGMAGNKSHMFTYTSHSTHTSALLSLLRPQGHTASKSLVIVIVLLQLSLCIGTLI